MKRILLASCAIFIQVNIANAQILGTGDVATETSQLLMWGKQLKDNVLYLQQLYAQYQQLYRTYNAIAHATDISSLAVALGGVTRTYLPEASSTLQAIGQGAGLVEGAMRARSLDSVFALTSRVGTLTRTIERTATEMERRENTTANAKAIAEAGMIDMQGRVAELQAAYTRLGAAPDGTDIAAVNGTIALSSANIAMHQTQIANMQLLLAAEDRAERQRGEQRQMEDGSKRFDDTRWAMESLPEGLD